MLWTKGQIDMQIVDQQTVIRHDELVPVLKKKSRKDPKASPAKLLVPKALKFSADKASVFKGRNKNVRSSKDCHTKEVTLIGPLQKLPGIKRSKKLKDELASSSVEQLVNVIDKSVASNFKEEDIVEQWQEVFSDVFCSGDASPLVNNA
ncbi:hypothetical protein MA16_Dca027965 [Dendrobium catenatum]|uniref:Uncharacterized protein n=1 Tax=Dendrobium catenatum TaxID=906689 RepID=A0A2I0VEH0_9ASPA|nr:hypothetical protein MA16_Dca027965 [Dendrobium catenatum]